MPDNGYIKIFRSLKKKGYYTDSHYIHLWVHLLMCVTYQDREYMINGQIHHLKPGQCIVGRRKLASDTGIQESKVERILSTFKSEHQIEQQSFNKFRIITICNWDKYQATEQQNEQQMNSQRTASEQPVNTINKDKKEKKLIASPSPDPRVKVFLDWWVRTYEKRYHPKKYAISSGAKLGSQIKSLLKSRLSWHELQVCACLFLDDEDEWLLDKGHDLGILLTRLNKYNYTDQNAEEKYLKLYTDEKGESLNG